MNTARPTAALAALLLFPACVGSVGEPTGDTGSPAPAAAPGGAAPTPGANPPAGAASPGTGTPPPVSAATCTQTPGPAPLRRLDRFAYDNTIRDLLGDTTRPASQGLPAEDASGPFSNQAELLSASPLLIQGYLDLADGVASRAIKARLPMLVPCAPAAGDEACARKFAQSFGRRAWRRPLETDELDALMAVYRTGAADGGFTGGVQAALEALLQAPQFLYLIEVGTPGPGGTRRLTSYEIAARLSYTLWASAPDDALIAAADAGQLTDKAQIAAQARRMLADQRARPLVQQFAEEWLGITTVAMLGKDSKLVPRWKSSYAPLFREETRRFFEDLVFADQRPSALTMFTGHESFMNADLAALYGVGGPTGTAWSRVTLPAQRAGVLTQMSLLGTYAKPNQTDPIHRGKFVRLNLMCGELPSAPSGVEIKPPDLSPTLTTRERFASHATDPFCAGCHRLMDPIGLTFEGFDAMGVGRDTENGKPIDTSGELLASDVDGKLTGAADLGAHLARSPQARACIAKQWFRFTFGRQDGPADACTIAQLGAGFEKNGFDLAGLIVDTLQTENFVARQPGGMP